MLRGKGPRDITESYKLLLTQDEYEEIEALVGNESFGTAYFQTSSPDETEDQLRVITGLTAEYHAAKPIAAILTTIRVRDEVAIRITSQEFETAWDGIEEDFAAGAPFSEGTETATTNYWWYADVGNWRSGLSELLYVVTSTGMNVAYVRRSSGHDYIVSDIEVECQVKSNTASEWPGIKVRGQHDKPKTAVGYGYAFYFQASTNTLRFDCLNGASGITLYQTTALSFSTGIYYTLKVVAQGDRFDLFVDGKKVNFKPIYDTTYDAGMIGAICDEAVHYFDNFKAKLVKPVVVPCLVGAQGINQHITHSTFSNEGKLQYVIAPEGDATYDQRIAQIASDACVFWTPLQEGQGIPVDHSGYNIPMGWDGTAHSWVEGDNRWTQRALSVSEGNQHCHLATSSGRKHLKLECYTLFCRVKFLAIPDTSASYFFYNQSSYGMMFWSDANFYAYYRSGGVSNYIDSGYNLNLNQWYDLAITFGPLGHQFYVDGILVATVTTHIGTIPLEAAGHLTIGNNVAGRDQAMIFGHAVVWSQALTASEIAYLSRGYGEHSGGDVRAFDSAGYELSDEDLILRCHFDEGRGTKVFDSSGKGHDSTGGTWPDWVLDGSFRPEARHCLDFERTSAEVVTFGDHADFSFGDGTGNDQPFSIECWIKLESVGIVQSLMSKFDGAAANEWLFWIEAADKIYTRCAIAAGGDYIGRLANVTTLIADIWYYCVMTYDGSRTSAGIKIYLNAVQVDDTNNENNPAGYATTGMSNTAAALMIGRYTAGGELDGLMDEPLLWGRELPAAEIQKRHEFGPILHDRAHWTPIRKPMSAKEIEGDLVVENGLERLIFRQHDGKSLIIESFIFSDGFWKFAGDLSTGLDTLSFVGGTQYQEAYFRLVHDVRLVEIARDRAVVEVSTDIQANDEADNLPLIVRYIIRTGFQGVIYELISPQIYDDTNLHFDLGYSKGSSLMHRFGWTPGNDPIDALLLGDGNNYNITSDDNYSIIFDPNMDIVVCGFLNQALGGSQGFRRYTLTAEDRITIFGIYGDDALAPCYRGGVAFCSGWYKALTYSGSNPFDGNQMLYREADTNNDDVVGTGTNASADAGATYGEAHYLITHEHYVRWQVGVLPKGEYVAIFRIKDADGGCYLYIDNDVDMDGDLGFMNPNLGAGWGYSPSMPFHVNGSDTIYLTARKMNASFETDFHVDYFLLFPISNAHNWPLDNAHQAMRTVRLELTPRK